MSCAHPDPKTVPVLFCRECGYFEKGVRVDEATDDRLRRMLLVRSVAGSTVYTDADTHDGETEPGVEWPPLDEEGFPF